MTLTQLRDRIAWLTSTAVAEYADADKNTNINIAYRRVAAKVLEWCNDFDFQEEEAYANLTADQAEYAFPADLLKLKRVRVTYDGTSWRKARSFDTQKYTAPLDATSVTNNFDTTYPFYDVRDTCGISYIALFPTPLTDVTGGLHIYYKLLVGDMSDDADKPLFTDPFHDILALYASLDWAVKNDRQALMQNLRADIQLLENDMRKYYSKRVEEVGKQMLPATAQRYSQRGRYGVGRNYFGK